MKNFRKKPMTTIRNGEEVPEKLDLECQLAANKMDEYGGREQSRSRSTAC
ncbi:MAG: hypothetical protein U5K71_13215 [Gracilimonas sp.]|nr:hypothetical protein [Gracilimonas sp.]